MRNLITSLIAGVLTFLFIACSEDNPSNVSIISSNEESSSSIVVASSSSEDLAIYSSSLNAFSSIAETSSSSWEPYSYGKLIDERDGQTYKTIKLGEKTWMAENLNYAYLQPTTTKDSSSECFNNEPDTCAKYGRLYLWSAAMDSAGIFSLDGKGCGLGSGSCKAQPSKGIRGACPENWHIPTESDMNNYINYANSSQEAINSVRYYWFDRFIQLDYTKPNINQKYAFLWSSVDLYGEKFNENSIKVIDFTDIDKLVGTDLSYRADSHAIRCVKDEDTIHIEHGELKDERDGQVYKTVRIGNQWWMAENLNYDYSLLFNSSDTISWCYNNDPDNCAKYGRLYLWIAAMNCEHEVEKFYNIEADDPYLHLSIMGACYDPVKVLTPLRGICPENWHVPSYDEWVELQNTVNNFAIDLKSTTGWLNDGNGSNVLGFNALPAGEVQYYYPEKFFGIEEKACFWTTQQFYGEIRSEGEWIEDYTNIFCFTAKSKEISKKEIDKYELGLSLRCVRDSTSKE